MYFKFFQNVKDNEQGKYNIFVLQRVSWEFSLTFAECFKITHSFVICCLKIINTWGHRNSFKSQQQQLQKM